MRALLIAVCPVVLWLVAVFHLVFLVGFFRSYRQRKNNLYLFMGLITGGLFFDALILSLGSALSGGSVLQTLSRFRYVFHGALIPLIFVVCAYALGVGKKLRTAVWILTCVLAVCGIAEGFAIVLELQNFAGVCRYTSGAATPAWAESVRSLLSFGTVLPLMASGIAVWIRQKTPALFLSGFLMFLFSALGPATGNMDLIFFISTFGEVCMVLFFRIYADGREKKKKAG